MNGGLGSDINNNVSDNDMGACKSKSTVNGRKTSKERGRGQSLFQSSGGWQAGGDTRQREGGPYVGRQLLVEAHLLLFQLAGSQSSAKTLQLCLANYKHNAHTRPANLDKLARDKAARRPARPIWAHPLVAACLSAARFRARRHR